MKSEIVTIQISDTEGTFKKVDSVVIIIRSKQGIKSQRDVYSRGKTLYASIGSGFVSLSHNGGTSSTSYTWSQLVPTDNKEFSYMMPHFGYLELA